MFAAGMLQQSSGGLNKRSLGMARIPDSRFFPLSSGSGSWGLSRAVKSGSLSSISSGSDNMDNMMGADPDYIMQLVNDVRRFADVLLHLKEAFNTKDHQDCLHQVVHERLGELLRVLKAVISKHHSLNSVEILSAAGTLIAKVKGKALSHSPPSALYDTVQRNEGEIVIDFTHPGPQTPSNMPPTDI
nr:rho GTPase-activating protein 29 isoform X5 [Danio rerio]|eukprot:XP_021329483.1 rho GTPase-activating protein 29 isoform X5 [Danio rerio]